MDATQIVEATQTAPLTEQKKKHAPVPLPPKRKKRLTWLLAALVLAIGLWFLFLRPRGEAPTAGAGQYYPVPATLQDLTTTVNGSGAVTPIESYQVSALTSGEILEAPFEVGDWIEKGDLLYQLDAGPAQTALQQAELSLRQAQLSYDSQAAALRPSASSAGVVQKLHVQKGSLVSPGTPIADVSDTSSMTVTLPFQAADAATIVPGQAALVTIAGTMETLPGTVESVSSADMVGAGGALVRQVQIRVQNPGALTEQTSATAAIGDLTCAGNGMFAPVSSQTVTAQTSGEVISLAIQAGSRVSAGDVLAQIGGDAAETALSTAEIGVENARLALQTARDALASYTITSPISGTVIEKNFKAGDKLDGMESGALAVIFDLSRMKLQMNVSELNISQLAPGQQVEITAEALPGQRFQGVVDRVSVNGTTTNGFTTYPVTVLLTEFGALNPGMNVSASIITSQEKDALCVPVSAVNSDGTVLVAGPGVLTEDGTAVADLSKAERRSVQLGSSNGEYIAITSGLEKGEAVLVPIQATDGYAGSTSTAVMVSGG